MALATLSENRPEMGYAKEKARPDERAGFSAKSKL
jgi:hypothetical protein